MLGNGVADPCGNFVESLIPAHSPPADIRMEQAPLQTNRLTKPRPFRAQFAAISGMCGIALYRDFAPAFRFGEHAAAHTAIRAGCADRDHGRQAAFSGGAAFLRGASTASRSR